MGLFARKKLHYIALSFSDGQIIYFSLVKTVGTLREVNIFSLTINQICLYRNRLEWSVQSVHRTAEIFRCRRDKITAGRINRQPRRGRGSTVHRSILPRRMGLEHLVGHHHGPPGQ